MFTGIILDIGKVASVQGIGDDVRLAITTERLAVNDIDLGESIAVNGVCLTVVEKIESGFLLDVSVETLRRTAFNQLTVGDDVNLELAVTPQTAMNGHIVTGHVDAVGQIKTISVEARSKKYTVELPSEFSKYVAPKGSITLDGVSLTVNDVMDNEFNVNIIPHTLENTIFQHYTVGSSVNLEIDIVARYLDRLVSSALSAHLAANADK